MEENEKVSLETAQILNNENLNQKVFEPILDKDEVVQKVFKPKKSKMFWSMFFQGFVLFFWFALISGFVFGSIFGETVGDEVLEINILAFILGMVGAFVVFYIIAIIFFFLAYKNTYYAYTNKRVIVRKGIIGVDYKSLDMTMIGAVTVNVSPLDKIVKNTGSIFFGSMANPISANNQIFKFANIENPYEVYKEIKSVIDSKKQ